MFVELDLFLDGAPSNAICSRPADQCPPGDGVAPPQLVRNVLRSSRQGAAKTFGVIRSVLSGLQQTLARVGGEKNDAAGTIDGQRIDERGAPGGEHDGDDDIDRVARGVVGMVGEGGVEGGMRQPALSTDKEKMNGEPRGGLTCR